MFKNKLFSILAIIGLTSFAGITTVSAQTDKKAQDVLDAMSAKFKSLKAFKANFTYTQAGEAGMKGEATVKGTKFRLKIAGQEILNDGKIMATYMKESNEVNVQDYDPSEGGDINPTNIYSIYKKGYKYKYLGETKSGANVLESVELTPSKAGQVSKVQITVDKKTRNVKSWVISQKNGQKTTYKIDAFQENPTVADALFTFNSRMFPGAEVIDLR